MKIAILDHNGVLADLKPHFELTGTLDEAKVAVLWNDVLSWGLSIARTAHHLGKKVVVIQHGRGAMCDYCPPFNQKLIADKVCVWGKADKDMLLKHGIPSKKIAITGTTVFNHLIGKKPHKGINILFSPQHWDYDVEENTEMMNELKVICKKNNWNLVVKVNETHDYEKYAEYAVLSHRDHPDHLDICGKVLSTADVLITMCELTFELLAQSLDIPVILADIFIPRPFRGDKRYQYYHRIHSNALKEMKSLDSLEGLIKQQLAHPEELREERKKVVIDEGGIDIENPLQEMIKVIKNV